MGVRPRLEVNSSCHPLPDLAMTFIHPNIFNHWGVGTQAAQLGVYSYKCEGQCQEGHPAM